MEIDVYIMCQTLTEYRYLMQLLEDLGCNWVGGDKPTDIDMYEIIANCDFPVSIRVTSQFNPNNPLKHINNLRYDTDILVPGVPITSFKTFYEEIITINDKITKRLNHWNEWK